MNPPSAVLGGGMHGKVYWLIAYRVYVSKHHVTNIFTNLKVTVHNISLSLSLILNLDLSLNLVLPDFYVTKSYIKSLNASDYPAQHHITCDKKD